MSEGRRILITGASRGLGLAIAERLSGKDIEVICASRNKSLGLSKLMDSDDRIRFFPIDLSNLPSIQTNIKAILKDTGPIWGLVNNAAVGRDGVLATMHEVDVTEMINLNITSTILVTKCAVRSMLANRQGGAIVNISSIIASTGYSGLAAYAATKAAMIGFTKSLARELGRAQIRVNCVSPGYMATDMTAGLDDHKVDSIARRSALGRLTNTNEVAAAVDFLMSDDASAITGTNMVVDAGSTA